MYTFNGIGTRLFGKAKRRDDGSYVATKWFAVLGIPIVPLASYRVHGDQAVTDVRGTVVTERSWLRMERVSLDLGQVLRTGALSLILILVAAIVLWLVTFH